VSVVIRPWRSAPRVETVFQAQLLRGRQRPDLVSQRAVTTDGFPDPSDLSLKHRRIDRLHPAVTPWRGSGILADQGRRTGRRTVKAGPWPILDSLDQSRTKRIPLDVPQHHPEVVINGFVTSTAALITTGWSDPVAGWELHPLKTNTFSRRTSVTSLFPSLSPFPSLAGRTSSNPQPCDRVARSGSASEGSRAAALGRHESTFPPETARRIIKVCLSSHSEGSQTMGLLDKEPDENAPKEAASRDDRQAPSARPLPCNDATGRVVPITPEEQARDARAIADLVERMLAMPDEDPPGAWEEAMRDLDAQRPHRRLFEGLY
jgi:hypothetical protein